MKNSVSLIAAIIADLLQQFDEQFHINPQLSAKQTVEFKNMFSKMLDFDRSELNNHIDTWD